MAVQLETSSSDTSLRPGPISLTPDSLDLDGQMELPGCTSEVVLPGSQKANPLNPIRILLALATRTGWLAPGVPSVYSKSTLDAGELRLALPIGFSSDTNSEQAKIFTRCRSPL